MATMLDATSAPPQATPDSSRSADAAVVALLIASTCIIAGLLWDISWHMSIGRDTLWSPPHVVEQIGAALAGLTCGGMVLWTTFRGTDAARARTVRFWGFRGPLGAWVAIWGAFAMMFSVPFDDWWHNAYGLDVEILSPPHTVLLAGMIAIQLGAMLLALGWQNRAHGRRQRMLALAYAFAAGALIAMAGTAISEYTLLPNRWHASFTYAVAGIVFTMLLVATGRAGRLRWPATTAAVAYMAIYLITQWILVQFPATPRLTPIVRPLTHMAAYGFPLLLVAPAFGIDLVLRRFDRIGEWKLAALLGVTFSALMLAVHWPAGSFLVQSPLAQNDFFLANHFPYFNAPGAWQQNFFGSEITNNTTDFGAFALGMLAALAYAMLSARVGLAWGRWMRRVQR